MVPNSPQSTELRILRLKAGLSLEAAAEGICSVSYLSLVERGKREASAKITRLLEIKYGLGAGSIERGVSDSVAFEALRVAVTLGQVLEARKLLTDLVDESEVSLAHGLVNEMSGDYELAVENIQHALVVGGITVGQRASGLLALVRANRELGDFYSAVNFGEQLLTLLESAQKQSNVSELEAKATLSSVYLEVGDHFRASQLISDQDSTAVSTKDGVLAMWARAMVQYSAGNLVLAANLLSAASEMAAILAQPLTEMRMFQSAIWLKLEAGDFVTEVEISRLQEAIRKFRKEDLGYDIAQTSNTLALALVRCDRGGEALGQAEVSIEAAQQLGKFQKAELLATNAKVFVELGEVARAHELLDLSSELLAETSANRASANVWSQLGAAYEAVQDSERALVCFKNAIVVGGFLPSQKSGHGIRVR